jgi:hypothetical protein
MREIFFLGLLVALQLSIFIHALFIGAYLSEKSDRSFRGFLVTTVSNFLIGMVMLIMMVQTPEIVRKFSFKPMMVLESGLVFFLLLFVKIRITIRIIKRFMNPEYYDLNFFGKKVYKPGVVKKSELAIYYLTMPFTLFTGAYFLANMFFG